MTIEQEAWNDLGLAASSLTSDEMLLVHELFRTATVYAGARLAWRLAKPDDRNGQESNRTAAHNAFIDAANALSRACGRNGASQLWRAVWSDAQDGEQRRRIGDFACYIAWRLSLEAR